MSSQYRFLNGYVVSMPNYPKDQIRETDEYSGKDITVNITKTHLTLSYPAHGIEVEFLLVQNSEKFTVQAEGPIHIYPDHILMEQFTLKVNHLPGQFCEIVSKNYLFRMVFRFTPFK